MNLKGIVGNDIQVQTEQSAASKTFWKQSIVVCDQVTEARGLTTGGWRPTMCQTLDSVRWQNELSTTGY